MFQTICTKALYDQICLFNLERFYKDAQKFGKSLFFNIKIRKKKSKMEASVAKKKR